MGKTKKGAGGKKGGGKPGSKKDQAAASSKRTSCSHLQKGTDVSKFEGRKLDLDACAMCAKADVDLVVCLTCALVSCKAHAKKHWAAAKSYHCVFMDETGHATCWECDAPLSDVERLAPFLFSVTGDTSSATQQSASADASAGRGKAKKDTTMVAAPSARVAASSSEVCTCW